MNEYRLYLASFAILWIITRIVYAIKLVNPALTPIMQTIAAGSAGLPLAIILFASPYWLIVIPLAILHGQANISYFPRFFGYLAFFLALTLLPGLVTFGTELLAPLLIATLIWLVVIGIIALVQLIQAWWRSR